MTDDRRDSKWKKNIPLLTIDNFDEWLLKEFSRPTPVQWDFNRVMDKLTELEKSSDRMFKFHMAKIMGRKKG